MENGLQASWSTSLSRGGDFGNRGTPTLFRNPGRLECRPHFSPLSSLFQGSYHRFMPPKPSTVASAGPPIQVLVVDNDPAHAETMADSLRSIGFACTVATGGREAVSLLESSTFEIVVTDLKMPDVG